MLSVYIEYISIFAFDISNIHKMFCSFGLHFILKKHVLLNAKIENKQIAEMAMI